MIKITMRFLTGNFVLFGQGRYFCLGLLAVAIVVSTKADTVQPSRIENDHVLVAFDRGSGVFTRIRDKSSGIELGPSAELADNFRLVILRSDKSMATILGKDQTLSGVGRTTNGLVLRWDGPLKDESGNNHQIVVRMKVTAEGSELRFGLEVDNNTADKVKEVCYPLIGGLNRFGAQGKPPDGVLWLPTSATHKLELPFETKTGGYPGQLPMAFTCIQSTSTNKSLYFGSHDEVARYKVFQFMEHTNSTATNIFASIQHLPFTPPGRSFTGSTVVLRVVEGDWRGGAAIYKAWFEKTFGVSKPSDCWLRRESFSQFTMFMLPEGTINYRFKDIPRWAKDAKDHGINSVHISGWQTGGHDNGYPDYSPDPRLGTWAELAAGIKACHKMGLKVHFFVNYQPVMVESDWFKKELYKYHEWAGPDGGFTWNTGWPMGTLWGRMGNPKRMVWANPAFPEFRKIIVDQIVKLAQIGADGIHVDKMFPSALDYNPNLPLSPDTATWEGAIMLTKEVFAACRKYNPDWAMTFECNWDRMMQFTCSTWWGGGFNRSVFPNSVGTLFVTSAFEYRGVNDLIIGRTTGLIGPMNFCRSVGWKPWEGLSKYIKEVKRIQDDLADVVWVGEELGQQGVHFNGAVGCSYNVFRNPVTGKRVCILSNSSRVPRKESLHGFTASEGMRVRIHTPFAAVKTRNLPAEIEVPGERIVFIEEVLADSATHSQLPVAAHSRFGFNRSLRLEDERYLVEVDRKHGSITRVYDKKGDLELISDARLADNYRFTLPIPGKEPWSAIEANYIWGRDQKLDSFEVGATNLTLRWGRPLANYLGEKFDVAASTEIKLTPDGIELRLRVENGTSNQIGEVFFPVLGGIRGVGKTGVQLKETLFVHPVSSNVLSSKDIFRVFVNNPNSWLGDQGPEQYFAYPKESSEVWMKLFAPKLERSAHLSVRNPSKRSLAHRLELIPGNSQNLRDDGNWPRANELQGQPVGVSLSLVEFANAPAKSTYQSSKVLINFREDHGVGQQPQ